MYGFVKGAGAYISCSPISAYLDDSRPHLFSLGWRLSNFSKLQSQEGSICAPMIRPLFLLEYTTESDDDYRVHKSLRYHLEV